MGILKFILAIAKELVSARSDELVIGSPTLNRRKVIQVVAVSILIITTLSLAARIVEQNTTIYNLKKEVAELKGKSEKNPAGSSDSAQGLVHKNPWPNIHYGNINQGAQSPTDTENAEWP